MIRPGDLTGHSDFHLFKEGIKPMWEVGTLNVHKDFTGPHIESGQFYKCKAILKLRVSCLG